MEVDERFCGTLCEYQEDGANVMLLGVTHEEQVACGNGREEKVQDMAGDRLGTGTSKGMEYQAGSGRDNGLHVEER